jgi:hypothetical protein
MRLTSLLTIYGTAVPSPKSQKLWEDSHEVCEEKRPDKDSFAKYKTF